MCSQSDQVEMDHHKQPHAVFIPAPGQGHIKGLLKLAKLLHHKGFFITFVNTDFNHNRFKKAGLIDSFTNFSNFQFKKFPDGLPPSDPDATQDVAALCGAIRRNFFSAFRKVVLELNDKSLCPKNPLVTCIVSDGTMPFTIDVGKELGIPVVVFWTFSACGFMGFFQYRALVEKGLTAFIDESILSNEFLDTIIDWIPGFENVRYKDLPTFFLTKDPNEEVFNLAMESTQKASEASALGIQTFDALEPNVLNALSSIFPNLYTIGPLEPLLNKISNGNRLNSLGYSLWKEDPHCLTWLDLQKPGSVIYVNFGSVVVMSNEKLIEFAWGLANSNQSFLWIIRPDLVTGSSAILPPEFERETRGRSLIAGWCAQEEVLNHPSIGGFLTHCGWNSTIESLTAGVPMLCWPFFADQQTNCRFICTEWGVGMEIDNDVKRDEVEKLIRELAEGEKGMKMKRKALEWKTLAEESTRPGGSSSANLDKLVNLLEKNSVI